MHLLKIYENERLIRYLVEESVQYEGDTVNFSLITDFKESDIYHSKKRGMIETSSLITEESIEKNSNEAFIIWMIEYSGPMGTGIQHSRIMANTPVNLSKDECRKRLQVDFFSADSRYLK
jgi:hypothetical protein